MATQATILTNAGVIKNETVTDANTATRVGTTLEDLANKVRPYKRYVALLTQSSTSAPTVIVLENDLGFTPTWGRAGAGQYITTSVGNFPAASTWYNISNNDGDSTNDIRAGGDGTDNSILVITKTSNVGADSILSKTPIEIRVYE